VLGEHTEGFPISHGFVQNGPSRVDHVQGFVGFYAKALPLKWEFEAVAHHILTEVFDRFSLFRRQGSRVQSAFHPLCLCSPNRKTLGIVVCATQVKVLDCRSSILRMTHFSVISEVPRSGSLSTNIALPPVLATYKDQRLQTWDSGSTFANAFTYLGRGFSRRATSCIFSPGRMTSSRDISKVSARVAFRL